MKSFQTTKNSMISSFSKKDEICLDHRLIQRLLHISKALPAAGHFLMTGSDLLDCFASSYSALGQRTRKDITTLTYLSFAALLEGETPNTSLLLDHLFSLKATSESTKGSSSLLQDLVSHTPLLPKLRQHFSSSDASRAKSLLASLEAIRIPGQFSSRKRPRRKVDKGKGKASAASTEIHIHRMSLIAQVQDLFPDLGSAFVLQLLDEYNEDVEQATSHLLEDTLPAHLQAADRTADLSLNKAENSSDLAPDLAPRPTPPASPPPPSYPYASDIPERRNVYDNDELSNFTIKASNLHMGKTDRSANQGGANKAAILSALAAFDADDDERDDTYDIADVGGSVDAVNRPGDEQLRDREAAGGDEDQQQAALFRAFKNNESVFNRDATTRRSQQRQALKKDTAGMTDEAIEGWAIMVRRDPQRLRRLEERFAVAAGGLGAAGSGQTHLGRTAWTAEDMGEHEDEGEQEMQQANAFRARGRGGGEGRVGRGRGGASNVAGQANEKDTQMSRHRKEANKGSRANHNRRDQRAKKMARGGMRG
ncbi:MAG: hypothetical protein M1831_006396 [Alyxoria varia]|nr:MAG: hypothetical protein M1831_006396 [Alyxoria varia]